MAVKLKKTAYPVAEKKSKSTASSGGIGYTKTTVSRATGNKTTTAGRTTPVAKDTYNSGAAKMMKTKTPLYATKVGKKK